MDSSSDSSVLLPPYWRLPPGLKGEHASLRVRFGDFFRIKSSGRRSRVLLSSLESALYSPEDSLTGRLLLRKEKDNPLSSLFFPLVREALRDASGDFPTGRLRLRIARSFGRARRNAENELLASVAASSSPLLSPFKPRFRRRKDNILGTLLDEIPSNVEDEASGVLSIIYGTEGAAPRRVSQSMKRFKRGLRRPRSVKKFVNPLFVFRWPKNQFFYLCEVEPARSRPALACAVASRIQN